MEEPEHPPGDGPDAFPLPFGPNKGKGSLDPEQRPWKERLDTLLQKDEEVESPDVTEDESSEDCSDVSGYEDEDIDDDDGSDPGNGDVNSSPNIISGKPVGTDTSSPATPRTPTPGTLAPRTTTPRAPFKPKFIHLTFYL
jgi:hypothetical protein